MTLTCISIKLFTMAYLIIFEIIIKAFRKKDNVMIFSRQSEGLKKNL